MKFVLFTVLNYLNWEAFQFLTKLNKIVSFKQDNAQLMKVDVLAEIVISMFWQIIKKNVKLLHKNTSAVSIIICFHSELKHTIINRTWVVFI